MLRKIKKMSRVKIGLDFSTKFNPSITLKIEKKNPPSHFCYFFRARKQRNKNEKRNKNEWVVTKMRNDGFTAFF